jgi:acyl-CoA oxidase
MMPVRELITCVAMRNYAIPIIIAVRYSLFRRQFRNGQKEEISIIEYQTQQDKIISRIAEYYAMSSGGTKIRLCS